MIQNMYGVSARFRCPRVPPVASNRSALRMLCIGFLVIGGLTLDAPRARAYNQHNGVDCHFPTGNLKWKNSTTRTGYSDPAIAATGAWTGTPTPIVLTSVSSGANITVSDGVFTDPDLWGITQYGAQTNCGGGYYSYGPVSWFNRTALDSKSQNARRSVMVHELGHALGLGHTSIADCTSIMSTYVNTFWLSCGMLSPGSDDVAGINVLY
jgi:matrixin